MYSIEKYVDRVIEVQERMKELVQEQDDLPEVGRAG